MKQRLIASALFALLVTNAQAQVLSPVTPLINGSPGFTSSNPGNISGTFSATLTGFTPGNTFATLTATGSSASVALPAGTTVAIQNTGTTTVSCTLGIGSATALASEIQVPASSSVFVTPGSNTFGACIDQTGSVSNLVVLAGGSGLGTGFGGGGGGSAGSSAITTWGGATLGAATAWGSAPTGNVNGVNANVLASVLPTGASTSANQSTEITSLGTIATNSGTQATAANQATGNASLVTLHNDNTATLAAINGPIAAGGATIGTTGQLPYPIGAVPITNGVSGTTAATTSTLAGATGKTTYVCGYSIRANATANTIVTDTLTGVLGGTLPSALWVPANTAGMGIDEQIFSPCLPASATNTAISAVSGAPGTGGLVTSKIWGFQL